MSEPEEDRGLPVLRIQRHMMCCGMTYTQARDPRNPRTTEAWLAREVDLWAKNHGMTCKALKETDDDTE